MRTGARDIARKRIEEPMTRLESLVMAIDALSEKQYGQFRRCFIERDWAKLDQQIEADSAARRLDFLHSEAQRAKEKETLKNL